MSKFTTREDYQRLLQYILDVCGRAVHNSQSVTPIALAGHYVDASLADLAVYDLRKVQATSSEKAASFVKDLSSSGQYDFVAYVSGAQVVEQDEHGGAISDSQAVLTLIYTDDCQAFAHHIVDAEARCIIPSELAFVGDAALQIQSTFLREARTLH